ncbi:MAG: glycosyltransferase family 39 protein [Solirubrobacteraceae bacterium]|nr:glycosyltransferase family 39 protein [Solirubrobacteraceae bacterium]
MPDADRLSRPPRGPGDPGPSGPASAPDPGDDDLPKAAAWGGELPGSLRMRWGIAVALLVLGGLGLRLWGIRNGLPWAYNADENGHFLPQAVGMFRGDLNPHYFINPPGFTYAVHLGLWIRFGGGEGVWDAYAANPGDVLLVGRTVAALLSVSAVALIYLAGTRLLDRHTGILAAGLLSVAFLPVFYGHLALNDAPQLAPIALGLWASAGVLRLGRDRDYLVAGLAIGLAAAFKYTGGIVLLPLVAAAAIQAAAPGGRIPALRGILLALLTFVLGFIAANPYALLAFDDFWFGISFQSEAAGETTVSKIGSTHDHALPFYIWTVTWGLGVVPLIAAIGSLVPLWRDDRRVLLVLAPAPLLFLLFMSSQGRYFARWLLPIYPMLALLAGYGVSRVVAVVAERLPGWRHTALAVGGIVLCGQGLVASVHVGTVLNREDTRNVTRAWLVEHVPEGERIVLEPVVPTEWLRDPGRPGMRWERYPISPSPWDFEGDPAPGGKFSVTLENYTRSLDPRLIDRYEERGWCWVVTGSTQRGRAERQPELVPRAIAYYAELERRADEVFVASPFRRGADPVPFDFDFSFDYYPREYERPGALMTVYRLRGGTCATPATPAPVG